MELIIKLFIITILNISLYYETNGVSQEDKLLLEGLGTGNSGGISQLKLDPNRVVHKECKFNGDKCKDGKECYLGKCYFRSLPGQPCTQNQECRGLKCEGSPKKCTNRCFLIKDCYSSDFCDKGEQRASDKSGLCEPKRDPGQYCYNNDNCKSGLCNGKRQACNQFMENLLDDYKCCEFDDQCKSGVCKADGIYKLHGIQNSNTVCLRLKPYYASCTHNFECATDYCVKNLNSGNKLQCLGKSDSQNLPKDLSYRDPNRLSKGGLISITGKEFSTFLEGVNKDAGIPI